MILKYPLTTEKSVKLIEMQNTLTFVVDLKTTKNEIKEAIEKEFKVKVAKINTQIRNNKKIAFIKLKDESPAIDIATKLGMM